MPSSTNRPDPAEDSARRTPSPKHLGRVLQSFPRGCGLCVPRHPKSPQNSWSTTARDLHWPHCLRGRIALRLNDSRNSSSAVSVSSQHLATHRGGRRRVTPAAVLRRQCFGAFPWLPLLWRELPSVSSASRNAFRVFAASWTMFQIVSNCLKLPLQTASRSVGRRVGADPFWGLRHSARLTDTGSGVPRSSFRSCVPVSRNLAARPSSGGWASGQCLPASTREPAQAACISRPNSGREERSPVSKQPKETAGRGCPRRAVRPRGSPPRSARTAPRSEPRQALRAAKK